MAGHFPMRSMPEREMLLKSPTVWIAEKQDAGLKETFDV